MQKEIIWDDNWELLLFSAHRWELHSKDERQVFDYIKKNISQMSSKGISTLLENCIDTIPLDKELNPNQFKDEEREFFESQITSEKKFKKKTSKPINKDVEHIIDYAVQYSIGRRTYMPGVVISFIHKYKKFFSEELKNNIVKDITEARSLGDCNDPKEWKKLKKEFEERM